MRQRNSMLFWRCPYCQSPAQSYQRKVTDTCTKPACRAAHKMAAALMGKTPVPDTGRTLTVYGWSPGCFQIGDVVSVAGFSGTYVVKQVTPNKVVLV